MTQSFLERLRAAPLLADGGMGTVLHARGISFDHSFDGQNLDHPDLVREIHRHYIAAGAELIETNTFGANYHRLAKFGLEERVRDINLRGAKLARDAREIEGREVFVAGSMGPLGQPLAPLGRLTFEEAQSAFARQAEALLEGGVDLFILETHAHPLELRAAITAVREVSTDLPVVALLTFTGEGKTVLGLSPEEMVIALADLPIDVLGANCSVGPQQMLDVLLSMAAHTRLPLAAMPNAGLPGYRDGRFVYLSTPAYFATYATRFLDAGIRLIGGCCGTTPEHIEAMAEVVHRYRPHPADSSAVLPVSVESREPEIPREESKEEPVSSFLSKLRKGFVVSVELDPPRGTNPEKLLAGARRLAEVGVDAVNVADSPMARVRMACWAISALIARNVGVEVIMHFTCRDRNLMGLQSDLLGAYALGVRNIMAITGDPPSLGDFKEATAVYDVDSIGLVQIIQALNAGTDFARNAIGHPTELSIGVAVNPAAEDWAREFDRLKQKVDAGAQFAFTQPLYEISIVERFVERMQGTDLPVCLGILPLMSQKHAEFLHNEVPGISVPQEARDAMAKAGKDGAAVGKDLALELLERAGGLLDGAYLMPSFGRYDTCVEIVRRLKQVRS
jgi:methionine synthase I (cobalamin-dependent)/5,10-methylenetetrahydrofolate reductase